MLVKLLNEDLAKQISALFQAQLVSPVELLYFYNSEECDTCDEMEHLLDEIVTFSAKIHINKYDVHKNQEATKKYGIERTPGLVIAASGPKGPVDFGIHFSGIPSGYEFGSLIQAILLVSKQDSGLKPAVRSQLKELKKPVNLQVFVTPT